MTKHNNNNMPSSHARCYCGRYATLGECRVGIGRTYYICPTCQHYEYSKSFKLKTKN